MISEQALHVLLHRQYVGVQREPIAEVRRERVLDLDSDLLYRERKKRDERRGQQHGDR